MREEKLLLLEPSLGVSAFTPPAHTHFAYARALMDTKGLGYQRIGSNHMPCFTLVFQNIASLTSALTQSMCAKTGSYFWAEEQKSF
jgi:hypothetical protein